MPSRLRPPTTADATAVLDVVLARDVADLGVPDFSLTDLQADWATPGLELEHDARVAVQDGAVAGYAILLGDDAHVLVHPRAEGRGIGSVLRGWAEARAAERGTAIVRQFAFGSNEPGRALLRAAGYAPAQHYFRLRADLAAVPEPPLAAGLRPYAAAEEPAVHALVQEAFAEVDGFTPLPLDAWRGRRAGGDGLVLTDAEGIVGAALGERWDEATGYVAELAVARRARGRGLGRTLLLGLLGVFRAAGLTHAELSVHGGNRGALRLYESVGMSAVSHSERWEKQLAGA
jgi:ribosomal protein S18 acetylase RimI-like enzyme